MEYAYEALQAVYIAPINHEQPYLYEEEYDIQLLPMLDGNGSVCAQFMECNFYSPGLFMVKLDYSDASSIPDEIFHVNVSATMTSDEIGRKKSAGRPVTITSTIGDHILPRSLVNGVIMVSTGIEFNVAREFFDGDMTPTTLQEMIDAVNQRYIQLGNQPVDIIVNAHGGFQQTQQGVVPNPSGLFSISGVRFEGNNANVQTFTQALRGRIRSITLAACSVAANVTIDDTNQDHLMWYLARGLSTPNIRVTVVSFTQRLTVVGVGGIGGLFYRNDYWTLENSQGQAKSVAHGGN